MVVDLGVPQASAAPPAAAPSVPPPARRGAVALVRRPVPPARAMLGGSAAILGLLTLAFAAYLLGLSSLQQSRSQALLWAQLSSSLSDQVAPVAGEIPEGTPVALLEIPRLGLRQVVVEGTTSGLLMQAPGLRRDTVLPGQPGLATIAGRRATFGAPFRRISDLTRGDEIRITTGQGQSVYTVFGSRDSRAPATLTPGVTNRLNLVTSDPPMAPTHGLVVEAALTSTVFDPGGTAVAIRPEERGLAGDSAAVVPLVLWGQLMLVVCVAAIWGWARWHRIGTYVVATPVLLAVLANIFDNLARLLPNTL